MKKQQIKETLEITEAVITIVVSVAAVWGALITWESGFIHKVKHIVDYHHNEITKLENKTDIIKQDF